MEVFVAILVMVVVIAMMNRGQHLLPDSDPLAPTVPMPSLARLPEKIGGSGDAEQFAIEEDGVRMTARSVRKGLQIRVEGLQTGVSMRGYEFTHDVDEDDAIGDPAFDERTLVGGHWPTVLALLTPKARRRIARSRDEFEMSERGYLSCNAVGVERVEQARLIWKIARQLRPIDDLDARLLERADDEPVEAVRVALVDTLGMRGQDVRPFHADPSGAVRLVALHHRYDPHVAGELVSDPQHRAGALALLLRHHSIRTLGRLATQLEDDRTTLGLVVATLAKARDLRPFPRVDLTEVRDAARLALARNLSVEAACILLAETGDADDVPNLRKVIDGSAFYERNQTFAHDAIDAIKARIGDAAVGAVSIAALQEESGALSPVVEGGGLSRVDVDDS